MSKFCIPEYYKELPEIVEIIQNPEFQFMVNYRHHGNVDCLHHSLSVAEKAFPIAVRLNADIISTLRGALLHDFYLYDWHDGAPGLHGYSHPYSALREAAQRFDLNCIERDIIKKHMFPLTPFPPLFRESWIVCVADKISATGDYVEEMKRWRRPAHTQYQRL
ncbi:MAG TPA: phosphohydrolase [Spirochaeta sp.]|nr:phosphohydrolase [Spirochaeta sp.]